MQTRTQGAEEKCSRLFIGVRPDQRTQRFLDELTSQYRQQQPQENRKRIRWTSRTNRHLTLTFLGRTPNRLIPEIARELSEIASTLPACYGRIVSLAPFPRQHSFLLAAILQSNPRLEALHARCRQLMVRLGMEPEKQPYRPHITLARNKCGFAQLSPLELDFPLSLDNIILYQSFTSPAGSRYLALFEAQLGEQ